MKPYDVMGIGSALMDFLIQVDDQELLELSLKKGEMQLIDEEHSRQILERLKAYDVKTAPGGSSANTLAGVSLLGGSVLFCGKVGRDDHGSMYEEKMINGNIKTAIGRSAKKTGHAITFITPDSQRTFATHLGAALELRKEDVLEDDIRQSKILHLEGYQLEDPSLREMSMHALNLAKKHKTLVSIDLSDAGLVRRNLKDIRNIMLLYADIIFANEDEAAAFTDLHGDEEKLHALSKYCDIAFLKLGINGSLIRRGDEIIKIDPFPVKAVDTTGAGDMYAAGILYGLTHHFSLQHAGIIASYTASRVVEKIGARIDHVSREELHNWIHTEFSR